MSLVGLCHFSLGLKIQMDLHNVHSLAKHLTQVQFSVFFWPHHFRGKVKEEKQWDAGQKGLTNDLF